MYLVQPYVLKSIQTRHLIWRIPEKEKVVYLTFDDGPIPELTPFVLKTLRKYNAKATFFFVGDNVRKYKENFKQVVDDGHAIGNHTHNHLDGWKNKHPEYLNNVEAGERFIESKLFRPPYGHITPSQIQKLRKNYYIVLWSVLSGDFDRNTTPAKCLRNVMRYTKNGSIVVFHENKKATPRLKYALPRFLDAFSKAGYGFEALNEDALNRALKKNLINASNKMMKRMLSQVKNKREKEDIALSRNRAS